MKKLLILIFLSISISGYSQFVFKNGKSTARIDTIATNGNLFYFVNRMTNQICQAQVRNQALIVQNIYTFTDSLTTLRAFRDTVNRLKLTLTGKINYSDTVSLIETVYHASQTYLKINPDSIVTQRLRLTGDTANLPANAAMTKAQVIDNINARMGSGSTVYASDGVYKDADTVKLGDVETAYVKRIYMRDKSIIFDNWDGASRAYYNFDPLGLNLYNYYGTTNNKIASIYNTYSGNLPTSIIETNNFENSLQNIGKITVDPKSIILESKNYIGNSVSLQIDTTGAKLINADSSQFTDNHLAPVGWVKDQIYANSDSKWLGTSMGIRYNALNGDSTSIGNNGDLNIYNNGVSSFKFENTNGYGTITNTGYGTGLTINNPVGDGLRINKAGTTGEGGRCIDISRTNTGTGDVSGDIIYVYDNPSTSGVKSGRLLNNYTGSIQTVSLYPRATGTITPFLFQTFGKPTGNIFEFGMQGRNKVYADTSGHLTYKATHASIYRHEDLGDTTQVIPTGTTPTKILAFTTNGEQSNCTADKANNRIVITKPGRYEANLSISYASGSAGIEWKAYVFGNDAKIPSIRSKGKAVTANDGRSTQTGGFFRVTTVPYYVDYRVTHDNGGNVNLIFSCLNLRVNYIGD